jgi:hypothetical protein
MTIHIVEFLYSLIELLHDRVDSVISFQEGVDIGLVRESAKKSATPAGGRI